MTASQERILRVIKELGDNAYGVTIRQALQAGSWFPVSYYLLYRKLETLEEDGLLVSREGDPTPERGGRPKRFYSLTQAGAEKIIA